MIIASALIAKFRESLENNWGYIWGTAGVLWTAEKQKQLEKTTDSNRAISRKYGSKWIGHWVADCSGLFVWAYKQLGSSIYHGSDTIFRKYTSSTGELKHGRRTDGKELLAGSAVFTYNASKKNYGHIGLYVGNGLVIEAAGTKEGVISSPVDKKWTWWGELKDVDYGSTPIPVPAGSAVVTGKNVALREGPSTSTKVILRVATGLMVDLATFTGWTYVKYGLKSGFMMNEYISISQDSVKVTGKNVALRAGPSTDTKVLTRIKTGTTVARQSLPSDWEYVSYNGREGFMMKKFLKEG